MSAPPAFTFGAGANFSFKAPSLASLQAEAAELKKDKVVAKEEAAELKKDKVVAKEEAAELKKEEAAELKKEKALEALQTDNAALRMQLAGDMATNSILRAALATTQKAEATARRLFASVKMEAQNLHKEREQYCRELRTELEGEFHDRIIRLQDECDHSSKEAQKERKQTAECELELKDTAYQLEQAAKQLADKIKELQELHESSDKLKQHVTAEKSAHASTARALERTFADLHAALEARKAVSAAKDDAEVRAYDGKLQFDDLHAQWAEGERRIGQLQQQMSAVEALEQQSMGLQADVDNLHEQLADHDRTLLVKDARIRHLEAQLQKELQRNMLAADAANAASMTTTDEPPVHAQPMAESLEQELNAAGDDGASMFDHDSFFQFLEYSEITPLLDFAPTEPAHALPLTVHINEAASVAPVESTNTALTMHVNEVASVSPLVRQFTSAESPTQTDRRDLGIEFLSHATLDIAPAASSTVTIATQSTQTNTPTLTTTIVDHAIVDVAPVEPPKIEPTPTETASVQTLISNPTIRVTPVAVTYEEWPLEEIVPKNPTADANVQTLGLLETVEPVPRTMRIRAASQTSHLYQWLCLFVAAIYSIIGPLLVASVGPGLQLFSQDTSLEDYAQRNAASDAFDEFNQMTVALDQDTPSVHALAAPANPNLPRWIPATLAAILAIVTYFCFVFWTQLQAWKTANGVGFRHSSNYMADHNGAYGNGRYLFDLFPLAMTVGSSAFSEWVTRTLSILIMDFEDWTGISYPPLY